jgi:hypothetical protein
VWSAFEALLLAIGIRKDDLSVVSKRHDFTDLLARMRGTGNAAPFFQFVAMELDRKSQKAEVAKFLAAEPCCGLTLAKAVRHIFFHGSLTPNARQAESAAVAASCMMLADGVFGVMDAEFVAQLDNLIAVARAAFPH